MQGEIMSDHDNEKHFDALITQSCIYHSLKTYQDVTQKLIH